MHYIYEMRVQNFIKIGITKNVQRRIKQVQTGCPLHIHYVKCWKVKSESVAKNIEKEIHSRLKDRNTHGEWFKNVRKDSSVLKASLSEYGLDFDDHIVIVQEENRTSKLYNDIVILKQNILRYKKELRLEELIKIGNSIDRSSVGTAYHDLVSFYKDALHSTHQEISRGTI